MRSDDTIAAIASAAGPAAIGVIRISGPDAVPILRMLVATDNCSLAPTANAICCEFEFDLARCEGSGLIPLQCYIWPSNRSYTAQPSVELRLIGSPPILEMVLEELFRLGARPAQRGEFTLRAFLAGRLDLAQADAVLGVIEAADFEQLQVALKQLAGGLSGLIGAARSELLNLLADLEAGLDFVDEDIEFIEHEELIRRLTTVRQSIETLLKQAEQRMQSQARFRVVLGGLPNAGKSTLFNALVGRDAAIVSDVSGTTRDYLSLPLQWDGIEVELLDTAGWTDATETIEQAAQSQRVEQFDRADLVLWCRAANSSEANAIDDANMLTSLRQSHANVLEVSTKSDLASADDSSERATIIRVCAATGTGLGDLRAEIRLQLLNQPTGACELVGSTAARSKESLRSSLQALERAEHATRLRLGDEFTAIEIREALDQLGHIIGAVYTDDILDRIFSRFCIGK